MNAIESGKPASSSRLKVAKMVLLAAAIAVALGVAGYIVASIKSSAVIAEQKTEHDKAALALQKELESARRTLATTTARNHLLLASAGLYRTTADLDDRNFGTANTHLQEAAAAMAKAAAAGGTADPKLAQLSTLLGQMNINVATDLASQRNSVLQLAAQIDALAQSSE